MKNTGLRHAMINAGTLAAQFCSILKLKRLYTRFVECDGGTPSVPTPVFSFNAYSVSIAGATFSRPGTATVVTAPDGLVETALEDEIRFENARREATLTTGVVTETVTVVSGYEYQVVVAGDVGAQVACSGAFTGTLVATAGQRISWPDGTPKTAATTSLTLTVTGTLTELSVYDVTGRTNQSPPEYVSVGVASGPSYHGANVDGVEYFHYENGNTVDGNDVVTEAQGAALPDNIKMLLEPTITNLCQDSRDITGATWSEDTTGATTSVARDQIGIDGAPNSASSITVEALNKTYANYYFFTYELTSSRQAAVIFLPKETGYKMNFRMQFQANGSRQYAIFVNLGDGSVEEYLTYPTVYSYAVEDRGDWWKIAISADDEWGSDFVRIAVFAKVDLAGTLVLGTSVFDAVGNYSGLTADQAMAQSEVFTSGGEGIRAADSAPYWPLTTPNEQGMAVFYGSVGSGIGDYDGSFIGQRAAAHTASWSYSQGNVNITAYDGVNIASLAAGSYASLGPLSIVTQWGADGLGLYIRYSYSGAFATDFEAYRGTWPTNNQVNAGSFMTSPLRVKELLVYDVDQGQDWIEENL